jgi:hypothetical protein
MTVKELKQILEPMADDATVFARDRDCISLYCIDVVNHPSPPLEKTRGIRYRENITDVYGGDNVWESELGNSKQAIIFCGCD